MSQSQSITTMKIKVILGKDIRRWRYTKQSTLSSLNQFIHSSFNLTNFWLQYEDDEGDRLTLSSQNDFEDAFDCAQNEERKSLKIYVIPGSIRNAQKPSKNTTNTTNSNCKCSPPNSSDSNCKCPPPFDMKTAAIDFLQNAEIIKLLPDLHRRIFEEIKKSKTDTENEQKDTTEPTHWDSPQNVEQIMRTILRTEDKFSPIISHELYHKKLQYILPLFAAKISMHLPILMNFSTEAIAAWIPHLTSVITHGISTFGHSTFGMSAFFPLMCSFMSQHGDYTSSFDENGDVIHVGVACDGCNVSPIKGARFKCCICRNYDLCSQCESFGKHDANHPRIKFNHCARNAVPPFMGLHEIMSQFGHGPHKWFGHHWKGRFGGRGGGGGRCGKSNKGNGDGGDGNQGVGFQAHAHPHPPMPHGVAPHHQWWNQDDNSNWNHGRGRAWKRWNRYQQPHNQYHQQQYDTSHTNPWQQWCDNRNQNDTHNNDTASIISTLSTTTTEKTDHTHKKIKVMADFVSDVTLQDRTSYPIDTVLTKTWRMKNNGEYEWGSRVELVFFKGNESLTLEKRYPVLNAQPGQEVEISAVIKTPCKPGRYCSYYRLQRNGEYFGPRVWVDIFAVDEHSCSVEVNNKKNHKKQLKLVKKQQKLASKLDIVNKELDLQNENENSLKLVKKQEKLKKQQNKIKKQVDKLKNESHKNMVIDEQQLLDDIANAAVKDLEKEIDFEIPLSAISCVCGTTLHKTSPIEAYNSSAQVNCDICGKFCASTSIIYHCPNMKSIAHPEGYDLCGSCVEYQMQGFIPNVVLNDVVIPVENVFEYQQELEQLRAMNIADDERIKTELIKQKGNVQRVANRLLQLQ